MDIFETSLHNKEQKLSQKEIECWNCKEKCHLRKDCTNEAVCYECLKPVHKRGSPLCEGFTEVLGGDDKNMEHEDESKNENEGGKEEEEEEENDDDGEDDDDIDDAGKKEG